MCQQRASQASSIFSKIPSFFPASSPYLVDHYWTILAAATILGIGALTQERLDELVLELLTEPIEVDGDKDRHNTNSPNARISSETKALSAIRKFREGLLKAGPIVGFPRSINALSYFQACLDKHAPQVGAIAKADKSLRASVPLSERQARGRAFFNSIYQKHADTVLDKLNKSSGGDLGEFAVNCLYGDLIAETTILGPKETAMLQFVCCLSLGKECQAQAKGHLYGARNLENSGAEIRAAINLVTCLADTLNASWEREDMPFLKIADEW